MLNDHDKFTLYSELSKLSSAGFPIHKAIESILDTKPPKQQSHYLLSTLKGIKENKTFSESIQFYQDNISSLEISLIRSAEKSGKIPEILGLLSNYFRLQNKAKKKIRSGLSYPIIMLHFAILLPALPRAAASRNLGKELLEVLIIIIVGYLILGLGIYFLRFVLRKAETNANYDKLLRRIPLISKARRAFSLSRFTEILRIYLISSHSVSDALSAAAKASLSGQILESVSERVSPSVNSGNLAGPLLASESQTFPSSFTRAYITSEDSGTLDVELAQWSEIFAEDAEAQCKKITEWAPKLTYGIIVIIVIWQIFAIFGVYLETFERLINY